MLAAVCVDAAAAGNFPPASIIWFWVKLLCQVFLAIFGVEGILFVWVEDFGAERAPWQENSCQLQVAGCWLGTGKGGGKGPGLKPCASAGR
jgi:hypothetical protein